MTDRLTTPNPNRHCMFPIKYTEIFKMYKTACNSVWFSDEIDLSQDERDWTEKLNNDERYYIKNILAFFAASDGIVNENIVSNFSMEFQVPEIRSFYSMQNFIETIHSETYSMLIDTLIKDQNEKDHLFNAILEIPTIKQKADFCFKYMDSNKYSLSHRLIGFACVEGIFFSSSFCSIYWLKKRGLMPGLSFSNELISRDEGLHTQFACLLYRYCDEITEQDIKSIINEACMVECEFVRDILPVSLIGMNCNLMLEYVQFVCDYLLQQLGCSKIYNVNNPFPFMDLISLEGKTNFFERRVGEYSKGLTTNKNDKSFKIVDEF